MSDKFFDKRRKPVMIMTAASTIFTMYALIYSPGDPIVLASIFIVTGILFNIGYSTFLVYPMGLASKDKVPFAAAIVNTMGSLGGAFAPFTVGLILDWYNWDIVFLFRACCSLATLVIVLTIIEPMAARQRHRACPRVTCRLGERLPNTLPRRTGLIRPRFGGWAGRTSQMPH